MRVMQMRGRMRVMSVRQGYFLGNSECEPFGETGKIVCIPTWVRKEGQNKCLMTNLGWPRQLQQSQEEWLEVETNKNAIAQWCAHDGQLRSD